MQMRSDNAAKRNFREVKTLELRTLEYFLAVAREQNITAAAEALHISQPALSRQIKAMEDELGKQLIIRGARGSRKLILTDEGQILKRRAEEILSLMRRTEDEISGSSETIAGTVFIGAGETASLRLFARVAKDIQKSYPDVSYSITSGNAEHIMDHLEKGLIDFGLVFTDVDDPRYETFPAHTVDTWGVLMKNDSPLSEKPFIEAGDLWDKPLILPRQRGDRPLLYKWFGKPKSELNEVVTYNLVYNASVLVDAGLGYALCFDRLINTEGTGLCFRPLSPALRSYGTVVWKKYQVMSKAARMFLERLKALSYNNLPD